MQYHIRCLYSNRLHYSSLSKGPPRLQKASSLDMPIVTGTLLKLQLFFLITFLVLLSCSSKLWLLCDHKPRVLHSALNAVYSILQYCTKLPGWGRAKCYTRCSISVQSQSSAIVMELREELVRNLFWPPNVTCWCPLPLCLLQLLWQLSCLLQSIDRTVFINKILSCPSWSFKICCDRFWMCQLSQTDVWTRRLWN